MSFIKTVMRLIGVWVLLAALPAADVNAGDHPLNQSLYRELDSIIDRISLDSIESYSVVLESFGHRFSGTASNAASIDWLTNKFVDFGYDSVTVQEFTCNVLGLPTTCRNVIAVKTGMTNPRYQIIVGGHLDTVEDCPGADDNGTGTAAVLEIARVLQDVETNLTFIFILFDGEEVGMQGSWYYAGLAAAAREHIVLMFNIDMIGHIENDSDAYIMGSDDSYVQLWINLAGTLPQVGITGHLFGRGTDSHPFAYYGYDYIDIYEYIGTPNYHLPSDSTVYLNFDYMTRMTQTTLATLWTIDAEYIPDPELFLTHGGGASGIIDPGQTLPVDLTVEELGGATLIPGTVRLHYSVNDLDYEVSEMVLVENGLYRDTLPLLVCRDNISYYFSAEADQAGMFYFPGPDSTIKLRAATGMEVIFEDNFSSDLGWTASGSSSSGMWERVTPASFGWWGSPDCDFEGSGMCYLTDNRLGYDVDGEVSLTSPVIDLSGKDALVSYARWYSNNYGTSPYEDVFKVFISSNNGTSWRLVDSAGPVEQASGGWNVNQFWVSDYQTPGDDVRLLFFASDHGADSHVEAALDVVKIRQYFYGPRVLTANLPAWNVGFPFEQQLKAVSCGGQLMWQDTYGHLEGTGLSISADGMISGIPIAGGSIFFSVTVTDEDDQSDNMAYLLNINQALTITTTTLPLASVGQPYSKLLSASGGTGSKLWQDENNDLAGTGLILESNGRLSGTPLSAADLTFTARVDDAIGDFDEKIFTLHIYSYFVCGDANGDAGVNVGDAVFLINYVFKGGPAPDPLCAGDANGDDEVNVGDAVYLINYVFKGGPGPVAPCCP